jgi:hypothetical protein
MCPEPSEQESESRTRQCHAAQCFGSISWLSQQVFYLPCSAIAEARSKTCAAAGFGDGHGRAGEAGGD